MIDSVLDNPVADAGGITTIIASISMQTMSTFNIADINPYITFFTALGGIIYLVFKIKNMRLKNKLLKKELENADRKDHEDRADA